MPFRGVLSSTLKAVLRPRLIVPATLVLVLAPLSPASVKDASAQGFGISGFGGGGSFGSRSFNRIRSPMRGRGPGAERFSRPGLGGMHMPRPSGKHAKGTFPKSGLPKSGRGCSRRYGCPPGGGTAGNDYPKSGMGGGMGCSRRYGCRPGGGTAGNDYPKNDEHPPRRPRPPRRPPIVVAIPGDSGIPPAGVVPPPGGGAPAAKRSGRRPGSGVPPGNERRYVPNEVVVELASGASNQAVNALLRRHRLARLQAFNLQLTGTSIQRLRINDRRSVPQVVRALEADGFVMAAQPNYIATLQEMAMQAAIDLEQYALIRMRLPEAHRIANGNRIRIAVIDGGVDTRHPELAGMIVTTFDAIGNGDQIHPHGTSIVGAIAARARLRGTAPGAHILVARAFGTHRNRMDGTTVSILRAIDWAAQQGARVINMSFAGARDPALERHLNIARERGIVLVAAAGNAGPAAAPAYPAALPGVIAVTATDENDQLFRAANRGNYIAIAAPGVDLWLPTVDGNYRQTSGTSFAAAEVSGLIALMLEHNPALSPDAIRRALLSTARDLGAPGVDPQFGAGLVDALAALLSVAPPVPAAEQAPVTAGTGGR